MIFAIDDPLSKVALVTSVAAVIVPAVWWVSRRVRRTIEEQLNQRTEDRQLSADIQELKNTAAHLSEALITHMNSEERTNTTIENLGNELLRRLTDLERGIKGNQVHMMKALMSADPIPTMLWEVRKGSYDLLWANRAYLDLTGLSINEAKAGGVWLAVEASEREIVKAGSESVGQSAEDYSGEFTMVDPKTQEVKGLVHVEGHYIQGTSPDTYFYLSTLNLNWK